LRATIFGLPGRALCITYITVHSLPRNTTRHAHHVCRGSRPLTATPYARGTGAATRYRRAHHHRHRACHGSLVRAVWLASFWFVADGAVAQASYRDIAFATLQHRAFARFYRTSAHRVCAHSHRPAQHEHHARWLHLFIVRCAFARPSRHPASFAGLRATTLHRTAWFIGLSADLYDLDTRPHARGWVRRGTLADAVFVDGSVGALRLGPLHARATWLHTCVYLTGTHLRTWVLCRSFGWTSHVAGCARIVYAHFILVYFAASICAHTAVCAHVNSLAQNFASSLDHAPRTHYLRPHLQFSRFVLSPPLCSLSHIFYIAVHVGLPDAHASLHLVYAPGCTRPLVAGCSSPTPLPSRCSFIGYLI